MLISFNLSSVTLRYAIVNLLIDQDTYGTRVVKKRWWYPIPRRKPFIFCMQYQMNNVNIFQTEIQKMYRMSLACLTCYGSCGLVVFLSFYFGFNTELFGKAVFSFASEFLCAFSTKVHINFLTKLDYTALNLSFGLADVDIVSAMMVNNLHGSFMTSSSCIIRHNFCQLKSAHGPLITCFFPFGWESFDAIS